jgi:hypothetical protein
LRQRCGEKPAFFSWRVQKRKCEKEEDLTEIMQRIGIVAATRRGDIAADLPHYCVIKCGTGNAGI